MTDNGTVPSSLRRRLHQDIAELQKNPYPGISLHVCDENMRRGCLVLKPEIGKPLHLTVVFPNNYPLRAPTVTIQSRVEHPNVYSSYICASILNTTEGWTPAYTLKGVAIQLLSFFGSDRLEQTGGGFKNIGDFEALNKYFIDTYRCRKCGFQSTGEVKTEVSLDSYIKHTGRKLKGGPLYYAATTDMPRDPEKMKMIKPKLGLLDLPHEVLLLVLAEMDTCDIISFSDAYPQIRSMLQGYDFIRVRELQCFCLKKTIMETTLGIGVSLEPQGRKGKISSEFDLLSKEAFHTHHVRRSIQGVPFTHWLPLPLSHRHWRLVRSNVNASLNTLHRAANLSDPSKISILYHFMNSIVVAFSHTATSSLPHSHPLSTLTHASEKAVESYFALYHLLLCLATSDPSLPSSATRMLTAFLHGARSKTDVPDLGILLVAALISDQGLSPALIHAIIREAVLRNVVWMLDARGAAMPDLAYLEPTPVSEYRLRRTFDAGKTSYRLLMFVKLFADSARGQGNALSELRDALFETHGAPPAGVAEEMAKRIRVIREVDSWPKFLRIMGVAGMPTKEGFTTFLRGTVRESVRVGYSVEAVSQARALELRRAREPGVEVLKGSVGREGRGCGEVVPSFFPVRDRGAGRGGRRGWRGRGRGQGRGSG